MLFVLFCLIFVCFEIVAQWWKLYPYFDYFTIIMIMSVLFKDRCKSDWIWCDCHTKESFSAIKLGSIHHSLNNKKPVPSQEYNSCYPFVWCVWAFDFAIWLGLISRTWLWGSLQTILYDKIDESSFPLTR